MSAHSFLCDPDLLKRSLTEEFSAQQEDELAGHLEECRRCREQLEQLAAGSDEWSRMQQVLQEESDRSMTSGGLQSTLIPAADTAPFPERDLRAADFAVEFLSPSDDPKSLGRLYDIEILSVIGRGGNGIVLKGYQSALDRLVAVKVMAPHLASSAAARRRFTREAQAAAAVVHPNVMPILAVYYEGRLPCLLMPYVDCESLQDRLDRNGSLPIAEVVRIAHQVADGLAAAHAQGLVHRDVKPANILLGHNTNRVMLTDFGLARAVDDASLTRSGVIAGTPQYMSPEQARGEGIDERSDLFSLGSVMYCMCTGRPPFRAETSFGILRRVTDDSPRPVEEINPEIPTWLTDLIAMLMQKQSELRPESSQTVASALNSCVAHLQRPSVNPLPAILVRPPSAGLLQTALSKKASVYVIAALLALFGASKWLPRDSRPPDEHAETAGLPEKGADTEMRSPDGAAEGTDTAAAADMPGQTQTDTSDSVQGLGTDSTAGNLDWDAVTDQLDETQNEIDALLNELAEP